MDSVIGLEALVQRGRTPFFNDLVSLYQETNDALKTTPKATRQEINLILKNRGFTDSIKVIVYKHTGLLVYRCEIVESPEIYFAASTAVNNKALTDKRGKKITAAMVYDKIKSRYDDRTGIYVRPKDQIPPAVFMFRISTGAWTTKTKSGDTFLTAEEMAAMTLHEVGHYDHYIRSVYRSNDILTDASDIITYVGETQDADVILTLLNNLKNSKRLDVSWAGVLKTTDAFFSAKPNDKSSPEYKEAMAALELLLDAETAEMVFSHYIKSDDIRTSVVNTKLHGVDKERSADEYSARNGTYSHLVSGMHKIETLYTKDLTPFLRQLPAQPELMIIYILAKFKNTFNVFAEDITNGYDPITRRLELIVQTAKHAFSNENLSVETEADIKQQIADAEAYLNLYKKDRNRKTRIRLKEWRDNVSKFGRIVVAPVQSRLRGDYGRLQDATRDLSRNPLYYLAKK